MGKLILALAILLTMVPGSMAAENICDKIKNDFSRFVCDDPDLETLNSVLWLTFENTQRHHVEDYGPDAALEYERGHDEWLAYVARACTPGAIIGAGATEQKTYCTEEFEQRILDLGLGPQFGVGAFYTVMRYQTKPDLISASQQPWGMFYHGSNRLAGSSELARQYNAFAEAGYGDGLVSVDRALRDFDGSSEIDFSVGLAGSSARLITNDIQIYEYYHGAAHGVSAKFTSHFLVEELRALQSTDIFVIPDWEDRVGELAVADLRARDVEGWLWEDLSDLGDSIADPMRWSFSLDGFHIQFQVYEVAPYAAGPLEAVIAWADIEDLLTPDAMDIALSPSNLP